MATTINIQYQGLLPDTQTAVFTCSAAGGSFVRLSALNIGASGTTLTIWQAGTTDAHLVVKELPLAVKEKALIQDLILENGQVLYAQGGDDVFLAVTVETIEFSS